MKANPLVVVCLLLCVTPEIAVGAADPSARGPFEVGFTSFTRVDAGRSGPASFGGSRPVAIAVFYPVDARDVGPTTPAALYPWNPMFRPCERGRVPIDVTTCLPASAFQPYGIGVAYDEPPPSSAGPFPLLLLSPGARQPWWYSIGLATRVASHGFAVAVVSHWGDNAYPGDAAFHPALKLFHRPRDLSFALEALLARSATPGDLLHALVDPERVGAGGHSFGGYTALALAAGDDDVCDRVAPDPPAEIVKERDPATGAATSCLGVTPDPRFKVLLLLDASSQQLDWAELARVTVPSIGIGEDWATIARVFGDESAPWHAREHAALNGHPAYRTDVNRTRHVPSFTSACQLAYVRRDLKIFTPRQLDAELARLECNGSGILPFQTANEIEWRYAVAFLGTELAGDPGDQRFLTPGWAIAHERDVQFFVTEPRAGIDPDVDPPPVGEFWCFVTQPGTRSRAAKDPAGGKPLLPESFAFEDTE